RVELVEGARLAQHGPPHQSRPLLLLVAERGQSQRLLGRGEEGEAPLGDHAGLEHVAEGGAGGPPVGERLGGDREDAAAGLAAPLRPHRTSSPTATQNAVVRPSRASSATSTSRPASRAEVRRRNSSRIRGAAMPPAISAPAMIAAASPAML